MQNGGHVKTEGINYFIALLECDTHLYYKWQVLGNGKFNYKHGGNTKEVSMSSELKK